MKKPRRDPVREDRIHEEAIVDAGPDEQAMGWYYYLDGKLSFPFQARCISARITSPLTKGEKVKVLRMAPEDSCMKDMLVLVRWQGRRLAVPLSHSPHSILTTRPTRQSETGITGWHTVTSSNFHALRILPETSRISSATSRPHR
jgi:hypothetical protein